MILFAQGSTKKEFTEKEIKEGLYNALNKLGDKNKVLAIPPDFTRLHSKAGEVTQYTYEYYKEKLTDILPALGTHNAMTENEISMMFGDIPKSFGFNVPTGSLQHRPRWPCSRLLRRRVELPPVLCPALAAPRRSPRWSGTPEPQRPVLQLNLPLESVSFFLSVDLSCAL